MGEVRIIKSFIIETRGNEKNQRPSLAARLIEQRGSPHSGKYCLTSVNQRRMNVKRNESLFHNLTTRSIKIQYTKIFYLIYSEYLLEIYLIKREDLLDSITDKSKCRLVLIKRISKLGDQ